VRDDPAVTTVGAVFLHQLPPERLRSVARAADESGLDELWVWEDCFRESGIATAAAALAWTSRVRVGIGLLPVPLRNVAITAMEAASLHRLFPGRVTIGVGHGVQDWMRQIGARAPSPLTLLREHLTALRALLDGDEVSTQGQYVSEAGPRRGAVADAAVGGHRHLGRLRGRGRGRRSLDRRGSRLRRSPADGRRARSRVVVGFAADVGRLLH
jgi:alkanesulfonate monooxygenase SsuD/methylene tetrahydromethanopterin reductase-like flavin-dependent oxidoreductase (luciferase family)